MRFLSLFLSFIMTTSAFASGVLPASNGISSIGTGLILPSTTRRLLSNSCRVMSAEECQATTVSAEKYQLSSSSTASEMSTLKENESKPNSTVTVADAKKCSESIGKVDDLFCPPANSFTTLSTVANDNIIDLSRITRSLDVTREFTQKLDSSRFALTDSSRSTNFNGIKVSQNITSNIQVPVLNSVNNLTVGNTFGSSSKIYDTFGKDTNTVMKEYCKCVEPVQEIALGGTITTSVKKQTLSIAMGEGIRSRLGRNIKNEFSMNLESHGYFVTTSKDVFKGKSDNEIAALQCGDASKFEAAIEAKCGEFVSKEEREKRLALFLESFGQKPAGASFHEKMESMKDEIMLVQENGRSIPRADLERRRKYLFNQTPGTRIVDKILTDILKDSSMRTKFLIELTTNLDTSPSIHLVNFITKEYPNVDQFLSKYVNESLAGNEASRFSQKLKTDFKVEFGKMVNFSMDMSPTLGVLLSDRNSLNQVIALPNQNYEQITPYLEENPQIISSHFAEKCKSLTYDVSVLACSSNNDLISLLTSDEILSLPESVLDKDEAKKMACQGSDISFDFAMRHPTLMNDGRNNVGQRSSYVRRLNGDRNPVQRLLMDNSSTVVANASSQVEPNLVKGVDSNLLSINRVSNRFNGDLASEQRIAAVDANSAVSRVPDSVSRSRAPASEAPMAEVPMAMMPAAQPSMINPRQENTASRDIRSELRDVLKSSENKDVDRLVNNADDQSLRELMRLREEATRNREKLAALTSENERAKLKELEDKIKSLETKKAQLENSNAVAASAEEVHSRSGGLTSGSSYSRDTASVPQLENNVAASSTFNTAGTRGGAATSGSSAGAAVARSGLGGLNAAIANAVTGQSTEPVIILSSAARSQDIKSQELSQEILSYLSQTDADLATLQKIKSSGMVYKYKVLENGQYIEKEVIVDYTALTDDAKRILDQKLANKSSPSQLAALNIELQDAKRTYSYSTLKIILGEQLQR